MLELSDDRIKNFVATSPPGTVSMPPMKMLRLFACLSFFASSALAVAGFAGGVEADNTSDAPKIELAAQQTDYEECLACQ